MTERFFEPSAEFFSFGSLAHAEPEAADKKLGTPLKGLRNNAEYALFLIKARNRGRCVTCYHPARYVLELVLPTGEIARDHSRLQIAHVCHDHIPSQFIHR